MPLFLEPSAWVKLYVEEDGSEAMNALFARPQLADEFFASSAVALEMYHRLAKSLRMGDEAIGKSLGEQTEKKRRRGVGRAMRRGNVKKYRAAASELDTDLKSTINLVEIDEAVIQHAILLARAAPQRSVQSMDWIHLATAFHLSARLKGVGVSHDVMLVSSDRQLKSAARDHGMDVFDPCKDDPAVVDTPHLGL